MTPSFASPEQLSGRAINTQMVPVCHMLALRRLRLKFRPDRLCALPLRHGGGQKINLKWSLVVIYRLLVGMIRHNLRRR